MVDSDGGREGRLVDGRINKVNCALEHRRYRFQAISSRQESVWRAVNNAHEPEILFPDPVASVAERWPQH